MGYPDAAIVGEVEKPPYGLEKLPPDLELFSTPMGWKSVDTPVDGAEKRGVGWRGPEPAAAVVVTAPGRRATLVRSFLIY